MNPSAPGLTAAAGWQPVLPESLHGRPVLWLDSYADVRDGFLAKGLLQASYDAAKKTVFQNVLVTLDGPPHLKRKRAELGLVRARAAEWLEAEAAPASLRAMIESCAAGGRGDLVQIARLASTSTAARILGLVDCDGEERLAELAALMARLHEGAIVQWSQRPEADVARDAASAREVYLEKFFEPAMAHRAQAIDADADATVSIEGGLIGLLLRSRDEHGMDDAQMLRETIHFLIASAHTTATVLVHAFDEVSRWCGEDPARLARMDDPLFVKNAVYEALRLWPPSGWQFRIATEETTLATGRRLAAGSTIGLNIIAASRDPEMFGDDADRFDPDREIAATTPRHGLAFGLGVHICLGKRLAGGVGGTGDAPGVLVAMLAQLHDLGCRPDPATTPIVESATKRHQYRSYPVVFGARRAGAATVG